MIGQNVIDAIASQEKIEQRITDLLFAVKHLDEGENFQYYCTGWYSLDGDLVRPVLKKTYEDEVKRLQGQLDTIEIYIDNDKVFVRGVEDEEGGE